MKTKQGLEIKRSVSRICPKFLALKSKFLTLKSMQLPLAALSSQGSTAGGETTIRGLARGASLLPQGFAPTCSRPRTVAPVFRFQKRIRTKKNESEE
jgi:hypothetical protein